MPNLTKLSISQLEIKKKALEKIFINSEKGIKSLILIGKIKKTNK
jgi:hypothetical protein